MTSTIASALQTLTTAEGIANPYPLFEQLRDSSPVAGYRDWPPGTVPGADEPVTAWALFRYDQVFAAARDSETFSSRDPIQEASSAPSLMLVNTDPPAHTGERKLVSQAFSPRRIRRLEDWLAELVPRLLAEFDAAAGDGDPDVMEFAAEVPTRAMVRLLGLPEGDHVRFKNWANAFMLSSSMTPEERMASNFEMVTAFTERVTEKLAQVDNSQDVEEAEDLISALLRAELDGERLTPEQVVRFCVTLVVAGSETTTYLIGSVLHAMAREPAVTARLRADRSLVSTFIEEVARLTGPQRLFRIATRDVEIDGAKIQKGDWVALFFGSANHDPAVFEDPERLDLDRPNIRQHLAFGHGLHFCLGAPLARLEVVAVVNAVLDRYSVIGLSEEPGVRQTASLLTNGFVRLPMQLAR
ncbi:cytochrome P450 [Mycobacterium sp. CVI_P3]|uniref:Cytochrome P450 n=1 Tax=Mycobacterium pinniadriaticum TaxID=2994102 RepID=A0ABT3SD37_9MYCO|nr:cytochrome P450 [Mycobacterium pinniadriaticum]MCX2930988.1 cytochrome P450 [Mycobacterium pinniadriaticum]MCX2937412.1 cytochrome P450 [Mycobacterium pinniadriaticum]